MWGKAMMFVALAALFIPNFDGDLLLDRLIYPARQMNCTAPDSVIVVTGVSSGLGKHLTIHLAHLGYTVLGTVRKQADAESILDAVAGSSGRVIPVLCDVSNQHQIQSLAQEVAKIRKTGKRLVGLVNNAGVGRKHSIDDWVSGKAASDAAWVLDINVVSIFRVTGALLPALTADATLCGSTRVVNVGSLAGFVTREVDAVYSGSKAAVEKVTDGMRRLFLDKGIWVSVIEPGFVESNMCSNAKHCAKNHPKDTTTPAIAHALLDPRPRTRYAVAGVGLWPAWAVRWMFTHLHDCIGDFLIYVQEYIS